VSAAASCAVIDAVPNRACDDVEIRDLNGDMQASSFSFRCKPGFDKGYISFSDEGVILGSARLSEAIRASLGLPAVHVTSANALTEAQKGYSAFHRSEVFLP
jgi:hypothetical protein